MSAVGHCGDKAACEGFFGMLKLEQTSRKKYPTLGTAGPDVLDTSSDFIVVACGGGMPVKV